MHENTAINFTFKYCEYKLLGYQKEQAFKMAASVFKRSITYIATRIRKPTVIKQFFFKDGTSCTYNYAGEYFQFTSPIQN